MRSFGEILASLREERGIYQKELAAILKVSVGTISNYENNIHFPDQEALIQLAEYVAFGVACVAALNLLIPIWSFQIAFYAFVAGVPGLYFMVFILTGILGGYLWGPRGYRIRDDLYIAGQEELGAIDLNAKEFRYCREEKSWGEDIAQGVEIATAE